MRRSGTKRSALVLVVGVAVLLAAVVLYVALPPRQGEDVAVPADGATPEQVVTAYLAALDAHDCQTAVAVTSGAAAESAESWCDDVSGLGDVRVGDHSVERPEWSGRAADEQVVHVPVSFDLDWRPFHADASMAEGPTVWGYVLVRRSATDPWRIVSQGTG